VFLVIRSLRFINITHPTIILIVLYTVRMLNRLKAEHVDENVYLSSIVDEALRFYYGHVFEEKEMA